MSQMLDLLPLAAQADSIIPKYTPSLPAKLRGPSGTILGWTAGVGIALAVLGGLIGWGLSGIGHVTDRQQMAVRGKTAIVWSLIAPGGIGLTSALVLAFYGITQ